MRRISISISLNVIYQDISITLINKCAAPLNATTGLTDLVYENLSAHQVIIIPSCSCCCCSYSKQSTLYNTLFHFMILLRLFTRDYTIFMVTGAASELEEQEKFKLHLHLRRPLCPDHHHHDYHQEKERIFHDKGCVCVCAAACLHNNLNGQDLIFNRILRPLNNLRVTIRTGFQKGEFI